MPLTLRRGTVSAIVERLDGLVRLEVDGVPCVAYPHLTGPVALGDDVVVNVQARELSLGSGGFDVLHTNLTRGLELRAQAGAHVMKLPYTPLQHAVIHAEEAASLDEHLDGMPVVCCSVHSQVVPVCAALAGMRVAYVQLPGGALPVSLSDTLRSLKRAALVEVAIAAGPCFDGDVSCVSVWSSLVWAKQGGYDVAVCAIGPGIVGTASALGHGGMSAADAAYTAIALEGTAVVALRASEADPRERHHGVSHHTIDVLSIDAPRPGMRFAWPAGLPARDDVDQAILDSAEVVDVSEWRSACADLPLSHMGRGPDEDALFFMAAFAAGKLARSLLA